MKIPIISQHPQREIALSLLRDHLQRHETFTADDFYEALRAADFNQEACMRLIGACIRTASSNGWITRTNLCKPSKRNHSNLQNIWKSQLWKTYPNNKKAS